jgi:hypothetical protein
MTIDGIGWNDEVVKAMSKKKFVSDAGANSLLLHIPEGEKEKALGLVYDLITGTKDPDKSDPSPAKQD